MYKNNHFYLKMSDFLLNLINKYFLIFINNLITF